METTNQDSISHIQRLPDEVLARLFIVGSWLPGRMSEHRYSGSRNNMQLLQLKPYAKLVSQVCARWHDIVHWRSHGRKLYYASISLDFVETDTTRKDIVPVLKAYLDGIKNSEDVELYVRWRFQFHSDGESLVPLFLHGMNLTAPHFNRILSLSLRSFNPTISVFCFSLLNSLGDDTVLTHLQISDFSPPSAVLGIMPPFMPICAPFNSSTIGSTLHPRAHLTELSDLNLNSDTNFVEKLIIPANLLHLTLSDLSDSGTWNNLWAVLPQCGSLRTLSISPPYSTSLPELSDKPAINLPCLSELTFLGANVLEMPIILPLLITPHLKYLYFNGLYLKIQAEIEGESTHAGRSVAATRPGLGAVNSADSPAHSVRTFAAPPHLHIQLLYQDDMQTVVASLFASISLEAVETMSFDAEDALRRVTDANSFQTEYPLIGSPSSLARAIFDLFREHCNKPESRDMPEVRIIGQLTGRVLYSTLDHAEYLQGYITHEK